MKRPLEAPADQDIDSSLSEVPSSQEDVVRRAVKCIKVRLNSQIVTSVAAQESLKTCSNQAYQHGYTQGSYDTQMALLELIEEEIREVHRQCRAAIVKEMEDAAALSRVYSSLAVVPYERTYLNFTWDLLER